MLHMLLLNEGSENMNNRTTASVNIFLKFFASHQTGGVSGDVLHVRRDSHDGVCGREDRRCRIPVGIHRWLGGGDDIGRVGGDGVHDRSSRGSDGCKFTVGACVRVYERVWVGHMSSRGEGGRVGGNGGGRERGGERQREGQRDGGRDRGKEGGMEERTHGGGEGTMAGEFFILDRIQKN